MYIYSVFCKYLISSSYSTHTHAPYMIHAHTRSHSRNRTSKFSVSVDFHVTSYSSFLPCLVPTAFVRVVFVFVFVLSASASATYDEKSAWIGSLCLELATYCSIILLSGRYRSVRALARSLIPMSNSDSFTFNCGAPLVSQSVYLSLLTLNPRLRLAPFSPLIDIPARYRSGHGSNRIESTSDDASGSGLVDYLRFRYVICES